jgi:hypothetical protein
MYSRRRKVKCWRLYRDEVTRINSQIIENLPRLRKVRRVFSSGQTDSAAVPLRPSAIWRIVESIGWG